MTCATVDLPSAGRADEQDVVERHPAGLGGVDDAAQQPADALLADHLVRAGSGAAGSRYAAPR
jgi:hypothetical protein